MIFPLVTVIIPNYNHEYFLKERIDSVIKQTFQDFEIIIFDDASTDNSLSVLNQFKAHPKVSHFIVNAENSGSPFKQWKKGIDLAKGKYIWIAESDDFAEIDFLEKTVNVLDSNSDLGLVYTDSKIVDEKGDEKGFWSINKNSFFKTDKWSNDYEIDGIDEIIDCLLYKVTINNASAVLFRKDNFNTVILRKIKEFKNVGDLYTYLSICLENKISYIAFPLNNYREHTNNFTKKNTNSGILFKERIQCFSDFLNLIIHQPDRELDLYKLSKVCKFIIKKNGFDLLKYHNKDLLFNFLNAINEHKIFRKFDVIILMTLFNIYTLNIYKVKGLVKKIIKKRLA
jgi:glycosyltransferase involved in cell wall biosynthesis